MRASAPEREREKETDRETERDTERVGTNHSYQKHKHMEDIRR